MNLYKISQIENDDYDTYDSAIVTAQSDGEARKTLPGSGCYWGKRPIESWCKTPEAVTVELIGVAVPGTKAGVVLASFNAG